MGQRRARLVRPKCFAIIFNRIITKQNCKDIPQRLHCYNIQTDENKNKSPPRKIGSVMQKEWENSELSGSTAVAVYISDKNVIYLTSGNDLKSI